MSSTYKASIDQPSVMRNDNGTNTLLVRMWDTGPTAPKTPKRPKVPEGREGEPEYDLAMIEFKSTLSKYETALSRWGQEKRDFDDWHKTYDGPYELSMFSVEAREALQRDGKRYFVSDSRLDNHGLPTGMKPGIYHDQQRVLEAARQRELAATMAKDPVFGIGA
jgi:hypothetical protein